MIGYANYLNESVIILKVIDSGSAIGSCLIKHNNGKTSWVNYNELFIISWELVA